MIMDSPNKRYRDKNHNELLNNNDNNVHSGK